MNQYRIMLADDEEELRTGIMRKIDWEAAGFILVGDAENGEDALEKIDMLLPDVVLTDIRMPYMDGLTLAKEIRAKYPSIKIVIFSGHDEFEYAQKAIKLNVFEYILKPVNVEELTAILLRMHENMDNEICQSRNIQQLRERYIKSLPILREKLMQDLMHGAIDESAAARRIRECDIDLLGAEQWVVFRLDIEIPTAQASIMEISLHQEEQLIPISVQQLLCKRMKEYCRCTSFMSTGGLCAVAALDEGQTLDGLVKVLDDLCRTAYRMLELDVTAALGNPCHTLAELATSYKQAKTAMGYKAIMGTGAVISIGDVEPQTQTMAHVDMIAEGDFVNNLKFGSEDEVRAMVQNLVTEADKARNYRSQYQIYLLDIMNVLLHTIEKHDICLDTVFGENADLFDELSRLYTPQELHNWLSLACKKIRQQLTSGREHTTQSMVIGAKDYMKENYQNSEISLEKVCEFLHISSTYFSAMFKKETGKSYVTYLTELRLEKALELLKTTDEKTYIIAARVGYTEPNYFGYVFKKQYGVSPAKYRLQITE